MPPTAPLTNTSSIASGTAKPPAPPATAVADQSQAWFEDITATAGVHFTHRNGREGGRFLLIESYGGGIGVVDYDLDGDVDLFLTGGGTISRDKPVTISGLPSALFRNENALRFRDVTAPSGLAELPEYSQGCTVTDFNVDGFPDLFVCCYGRNRLYVNLGDGTYREVGADATFPAHDWGLAAVFADVDRDGLPDLFVARYADWSPEKDVECYYANRLRDICGPKSYAGTKCVAFHNLGDGRFEDWSDEVGIVGQVHGLAVVAADLNLDGLVDIYVASDITPKQLYYGNPSLPMTEKAVAVGAAFNEWGQTEGSMGVDVADYNGDGLPDIWVTNYEAEDNSLYRNLGRGQFAHSTVAAGLAGVSRPKSGFGTALCDFDNDSWPDLFILNGNPIYEGASTPYKQEAQLFRNLSGRKFADVSKQGGSFFRESHSGRGSAIADLDDDGAWDVVVVQMNEPVQVLHNRKTPGSFVRVQLQARAGEPDATGARVHAEFGGRRVTQFVSRGTGFFSQADPRLIFPAAPDALTMDITVTWPGRSTELFRNLAVRESHLLIEGRGEAAP